MRICPVRLPAFRSLIYMSLRRIKRGSCGIAAPDAAPEPDLGSNPIRVTIATTLGWGNGCVTKSIFTEKYRAFRAMLVKAREAAGMTQRDLSVKLSRPQSFVSKYELGERRLDVVEFLEVTRALGIDPSDLIRKLSKD